MAAAVDLIGSWQRLETVRRIANDIAAPCRVGDRFPFETLEALKRARLLGVLVPRELGGEQADLDEIASMCELLGTACPCAALVFAMHHAAVACIAERGRSRFLERLLRQQTLVLSSEMGFPADDLLIARGESYVLLPNDDAELFELPRAKMRSLTSSLWPH